MVDTLIKLGVDAETGSQIVNATRVQSTERQAVIAAMSVLSDSRQFVDAAQRMAAYDTLCENLSQLNTMRGGVKGFKGFVGEHMQAADYTASGRFTRVVDDNGTIDLIFEGKNGHQYPYQLKIGYKPGQIDFAKYKGQTVVVDKGNPYLREFQAEGARHGVKVVEGTVTKAETEWWAKACQFERKITHEITGKKTAYFIPQVQRAGNCLSAMHEAGKQVGKTGALYGAGFSIGRNIVGMMRGDVSAGEAIGNVARDTAVSYGVGYATGAVGSAVARTAAGKAVAAAAGEIGTAISGTAVGGAVTGVVGSATAAVGGMAVTATAGAVGAIGSAGAAEFGA